MKNIPLLKATACGSNSLVAEPYKHNEGSAVYCV